MTEGADIPDRPLYRGSRAALEDALAAWLTGLKSADRLRPALVVVGSNLVRAHLSRALARRLGGHAGVRVVSIHTLAPELANESLGGSGLRLLTPLLRERLVTTLVARRQRSPWYFGPVAGTPGLPGALMRTVDDLREAHIPSAALGALSSRRGSDLKALYAEYEAALHERHLTDDAGLYELAAQAAQASSDAVPVALFGLYDLPPMQGHFVAALAGRPVFAAFVPWGDAVAPFAAPFLSALEGLGLRRTELSVPVAVTSGGQLGLSPSSGAETASRAALEIVSVPDDTAQRRAVAAELLRAAADGLAFHEMAVVVPDAAGRDQLAGELAGRGVPVAARRHAASIAARTCSLLIDCLAPAAGPPLRRASVLDLAATAPRPDGGDPATVALWDTLARRARVVAADDWHAGLRREEHALRHRLESLTQTDGDRDEVPSVAEVTDAHDDREGGRYVATEIEAVRALQSFTDRLAKAARVLARAASWPQAVAVFLDTLQTVCGVSADEPVCGALAGIADVHLVDDEAPGEAFAAVVRRVLADLELPTDKRVGRDGVAVLSPHQIRGLAFPLVVVTDLAEGSFPPRPAQDPILLDRDRDDISRATGRRLPVSSGLSAENDALFELVLQAATTRTVLLFARLDAATGRPRLPSRVLLAVAGRHTGRTVLSSEFEADHAFDGLFRRDRAGAGEPLDVRDVDLRNLVPPDGTPVSGAGWRDEYGVRVMGKALAERAAAAAKGRRRRTLSPYDGLLSPVNASAAAEAFLERVVSPSAIEQYLHCPFAFYLRFVLGIEVPDDPDELLVIEPIELGNLVHRILQEAYAEAAEPTPEAVGATLEQVAARAFDFAEARGITGFPLAWQVAREQLLDDLRRVVATDPSWVDGLVPTAFEQRFGDADGRAVEVEVSGRMLRFRGRIDRVDRSPDGRRVRLVDYKTGKGGTEARRIKGGLDVPLPVYVLGVLAGAEEPSEITAEYRMVRRRSGFTTAPLEVGPGTGASLQAMTEQLVATLDVAVDGIERGVYPRMPSFHGCDFCDAQGRCLVDRLSYAVKKDDPVLSRLRDFQNGVVTPASSS